MSYASDAVVISYSLSAKISNGASPEFVEKEDQEQSVQRLARLHWTITDSLVDTGEIFTFFLHNVYISVLYHHAGESVKGLPLMQRIYNYQLLLIRVSNV